MVEIIVKIEMPLKKALEIKEALFEQVTEEGNTPIDYLYEKFYRVATELSKAKQ